MFVVRYTCTLREIRTCPPRSNLRGGERVGELRVSMHAATKRDGIALVRGQEKKTKEAYMKVTSSTLSISMFALTVTSCAVTRRVWRSSH